MPININITGLGFKTLVWKRFSFRMNEALARRKISAKFQRIAKGFGKFEQKCFDHLSQEQVDLLVVHLESFEQPHDFWRLMRKIGHKQSAHRPSVYLITESPMPYEVRIPSFGIKFFIRQFGYLELDDQSQIAVSKEPCFIPIMPPPILTPKPGELFKMEEFVSLDRLEKIRWQEKEFEPQDFFQSQLYLHREKNPISKATGFWLKGDDVFLRHRFSHDELLFYELTEFDKERYEGNFHISKLDSEEFIFRLVERANTHLLWRCKDELPALEYLKRFVPIKIEAADPVAGKMLCHHLAMEGFQNLFYRKNHPYALRLLFHPQEIKEGDSYLVLHNDPLVAELTGLEDLEGEFLKLPLPPENQMDLTQIQEQREKLKHQLQRLFERQKTLTSKKVIAKQEAGIMQKSQEAVDLLENVISRSCEAVGNERAESEEETLIFFEDPADASSFARSYANKGKNIFVDLAELESLELLLKYPKQNLEFFARKGKVFTLVSPITLRKLIERLKEALPKAGVDFKAEEKALEDEGTNIDHELDHLLYMTYWNVTGDLIKVNLPAILDAVRKTEEYMGQRLSGVAKTGRVALLSMDRDRQAPLCELVNLLFDNRGGVSKRFILGELELRQNLSEEESQGRSVQEAKEKLNEINAQILQDYFENMVEELAQSGARLYILDLPLPLMELIVDKIKERESLAEVSLIGLVQGLVSQRETKELFCQGVRLIYDDRSFNDMVYNAHEMEAYLYSPDD